MHEIASSATYNFKIFGWSIPLDPLRLIAPSGELGLTLIYAPCYAFLTPVKTSAKNPDQIPRRHGSGGCTMATLLIRESAS